MSRLNQFIRRLHAARHGSALVEFVFIVPILATLVLAAVEFANFVNVNQRMERVANTVGDFAARSDVVSTADLGNFYAAARHIAAPNDLGSSGRIILSTIEGDDTNGPQVLWQRTVGGALSASSQVGTEGGNAALPAGLTVDEGATVLITEVYFDYQPELFTDLFPPVQVYYRAFHRPRGINVLAFAP